MKKTFYSLIALALIAIMITGCKKEETVVYTVTIYQKASVMFPGEQDQLEVTVNPTDGKSHPIKWSSSDPTVASVTADGLVTAEGIGTATITAQSEDACGRCDVVVVRQGDYTMRLTLTGPEQKVVKKIIAAMPMPMSNEYQEISSLYSSAGEYIETGYGNKALYCLVRQYFSGMSLIQTFDFTPKVIEMDFSTPPAAPNFCGLVPPACYLGSEGDYIQLNNTKIMATGDSIWELSTSVIDYARRCYEFLATRYTHISGKYNSLTQILLGDEATSGDFATLFINLMRHKDIPSRHVIAMNTKGSGHTFADFYDEEYGWVPVDVDYKSRYPENDYFGKYSAGLIVENLGLISINRDDIDLTSYPFQKYIMYYWFTTQNTECIYSEFTLEKKN